MGKSTLDINSIRFTGSAAVPFQPPEKWVLCWAAAIVESLADKTEFVVFCTDSLRPVSVGEILKPEKEKGG